MNNMPAIPFLSGGAGGGDLTITVLATPYTIGKNERNIGVNLTVAGATALTLPANPALGQRHWVKDLKRDAGTNNITVSPASGTIDGAASFVINSDGAGFEFVYTGAEWSVK